MSQVFISYAREDRATAQAIAAWLEDHGWSVWWDARLVAGSEFDDEIEAALNAASAVVVLWSSTAVRSRWVRAEAAAASDRGVLVPVTLHAGLELPLEFRRLHTVAFHDSGWAGGNEEARSLLAAIEGLAGPAARSTDREEARATSRAALRRRRLARRALTAIAILAALALLRWGATANVVERMRVVGMIDARTVSILADVAGTTALRSRPGEAVAAGEALGTITTADGASAVVTAPGAGDVVWICCNDGERVQAGDELLRVRDGRPYAALMVGRDVITGQTVVVYPRGVNAAVFGGVLGTVRMMTYEPVDPQSLRTTFGEGVVEAAGLRGHSWLAEVALARDSTAPSGYAWTIRDPGIGGSVAPGVAVDAEIHLSDRRPIELLLGTLGWY